MVTLTLLLLKIQEQFTANDLSVKYRKKVIRNLEEFLLWQFSRIFYLNLFIRSKEQNWVLGWDKFKELANVRKKENNIWKILKTDLYTWSLKRQVENAVETIKKVNHMDEQLLLNV